MLTEAMPLDMGNLVNRGHQLALGLQDWWLVLPGRMGGDQMEQPHGACAGGNAE